MNKFNQVFNRIINGTKLDSNVYLDILLESKNAFRYSACPYIDRI